MRRKTRLIGGIILALVFIFLGALYFYMKNLKPEINRGDFISVENAPDTADIPAPSDSVLLGKLPKDSVKIAEINGKVMETKDGSIIGVKDSIVVAVKNGAASSLVDNVVLELKDGSKLSLNKGKLVPVIDTLRKTKTADIKIRLKDTAIVAVNTKELKAKKDSLTARYKDSVINVYKENAIKKHLDSVDKANEKIVKLFKGNKISIAITGLDSRIGTGSKHADANHVVTIWLDAGKIEIVSVPRGTIADAGHGDTSGNDYLANVRSNKGRKAYLKELSRISRVRKIDYYVEFGFSQAIGLIEKLGFQSNAVQVLRTLRSRKAFGIGDHHRSYNQGQFIRQMLLSVFPKLDGVSADIMFRSGLYLTETNLTLADCKRIRDALLEQGFPKGPEDVIVTTRPKYGHNYIQYDFTNNNSWSELYQRVSNTAVKLGIDEKRFESSDRASEKLDKIIGKAVKDSSGNPQGVIKALLIPFQQKAWFQISGKEKRKKYRDEICYMLSRAYSKSGKQAEADNVNQALAKEIELFDNQPVNK